MRRLLVLLLGLGPALAQGRLEASLLVWPRAAAALEGGLALGEGEVFFRLGSTRLGLEGAYSEGGYALWLRYRWAFGR